MEVELKSKEIKKESLLSTLIFWISFAFACSSIVFIGVYFFCEYYYSIFDEFFFIHLIAFAFGLIISLLGLFLVNDKNAKRIKYLIVFSALIIFLLAYFYNMQFRFFTRPTNCLLKCNAKTSIANCYMVVLFNSW